MLNLFSSNKISYLIFYFFYTFFFFLFHYPFHLKYIFTLHLFLSIHFINLFIIYFNFIIFNSIKLPHQSFHLIFFLHLSPLLPYFLYSLYFLLLFFPLLLLSQHLLLPFNHLYYLLDFQWSFNHSLYQTIFEVRLLGSLKRLGLLFLSWMLLSYFILVL